MPKHLERCFKICQTFSESEANIYEWISPLKLPIQVDKNFKLIIKYEA